MSFKFTTVLGVLLILLIMSIVLFFIVQPPAFYYVFFVGSFVIGIFMMAMGLRDLYKNNDSKSAKGELFTGLVVTFGILVINIVFCLGKLNLL